LKLISENYF